MIKYVYKELNPNDNKDLKNEINVSEEMIKRYPVGSIISLQDGRRIQICLNNIYANV